KSGGRFVVTAAKGARRRGTAPRVVTRSAARLRRRRLTGSAATTTEAAASAAAAAGLVDLGSGVPKRGPDLVDLDLEDGPLLAFAGLEGTLLESAADNHAG